MRSPTSRSNRATGRMTSTVDAIVGGAAPARRSRPTRRGADRPCARSPVALGERSYKILIGEGLIASAGEHIAGLRARRALRDRHRRERRRAASRRRCTNSLDARRASRTASIVCPPGEATKSYAEFARVSDALIARPYRAARSRRRARRRRDRRSRRLLRGLAAARRALRANPDDAARRRSIPASAARPRSIRRSART